MTPPHYPSETTDHCSTTSTVNTRHLNLQPGASWSPGKRLTTRAPSQGSQHADLCRVSQQSCHTGAAMMLSGDTAQAVLSPGQSPICHTSGLVRTITPVVPCQCEMIWPDIALFSSHSRSVNTGHQGVRTRPEWPGQWASQEPI